MQRDTREKKADSRVQDCVYVGMAADILHSGHIRLLKAAHPYGKIIVGLLTDNTIEEYKRVPCISYRQRKIVVENIKWVSKVVPQASFDYVPNLRKLKPKYVVHGSDWRRGIQKEMRSRVIKVLKEWGGRLVEPPYTKGISSTLLIERIQRSCKKKDSLFGTVWERYPGL
jgi:phosphoenolpyruvate phosphomutase